MNSAARSPKTFVVIHGSNHGGMVIAGVADRVVQRIGNLVFLDAVVPESDTCVTDLSHCAAVLPVAAEARTVMCLVGVQKAELAQVSDR